MCNAAMCGVPRRSFLGALAGAAIVLGTGQAHAHSADLRDVRTRFEGLPAGTLVLTLDACGGQPDAFLEDYLVREGVPCSIFATGAFARRNSRTVEAFVARGWDVLNHGSEHHAPIASSGSLWHVPCVGSVEALRHEVEQGAMQLAALRGTLGAAHRVYRGATALYDERTLAWLAANGWTVGGYSIAADGGGRATQALVATVVPKVRTGDVLLAHINHPERNNGVHVVELLRALRTRGFSFVSWDAAQRRGTRVETVAAHATQLEP